jgi:hypothetical protein
MKKNQDEKDQLKGTLENLEQLDVHGLTDGDLASVKGGVDSVVAL